MYLTVNVESRLPRTVLGNCESPARFSGPRFDRIVECAGPEVNKTQTFINGGMNALRLSDRLTMH